MAKSEGFIQQRRGILEHITSGKLTLREFGAFNLLLLLANSNTGVWYGCAEALRSYCGAGEINLKQSRLILNNLENKGYIKRFRSHGQRKNYPILIDKFFVTTGVVSGSRVNASRTVDIEDIFYDKDSVEGSDTGTDTSSDKGGDRGSDKGGDTGTLYNNNNNTNKEKEKERANKQTKEPPEELERAISLGETKNFSEPRRLAIILFKLLNSPSRFDGADMKSWEKAISPKIALYGFDLLKDIMTKVLKDEDDTFWLEVLLKAKNPMASFVKNLPDKLRDRYEVLKTIEKARAKSSSKSNKKLQYHAGGVDFLLKAVHD